MTLNIKINIFKNIPFFKASVFFLIFSTYFVQNTNFKNRYDLLKDPICRGDDWKNPNLPFWSKVNYAGENDLPDLSLKVVRSYPLVFFKIGDDNKIHDKQTNKILKGIFLFLI